MTDYLKFKNRTFICTMTGKPCPILKDKQTIKNLDWEGCACACDRPVEKFNEDRAEMCCINESVEPDYY